MSIGVGIFLMALGAIMAFAMEATTPGINVNTLGIILLLIGLVVVLYSLLLWRNLSPWGRRSVVVRRRTVVEERPVEVVEERPSTTVSPSLLTPRNSAGLAGGSLAPGSAQPMVFLHVAWATAVPAGGAVILVGPLLSCRCYCRVRRRSR
jgi:hypothetical protein